MNMKTPDQIIRKVFKRWKREVTPAWRTGWYTPGEDQFREMAVEAINAWREQDGIEVQLWNAEHDGVRVVQIDTATGSGRIRINLNDAPIWDGDPDTDARPGAHFHDVWDDESHARTGERNWDEQDWPDAPVPLITPEQAREWAGFNVDLDRLAECIPNSSIPDAINTIANEAIGNPEGDNE